MIQISTVGRVTADVELRESAKKVPYLSFDLAVTEGYGESKHTIYFQCWAFNQTAQRIASANIKKGSQIFISGSLDIVDFERRDGSKGKINKVNLYDWQYVNSIKKSENTEKNDTTPIYEEHMCNDYEDLPL